MSENILAMKWKNTEKTNSYVRMTLNKIAGNFKDINLAEAKIGTVLFPFNWGTLCFAVSVLLGLSYLRKGNRTESF